jgi:hypothetical protein
VTSYINVVMALPGLVIYGFDLQLVLNFIWPSERATSTFLYLLFEAVLGYLR